MTSGGVMTSRPSNVDGLLRRQAAEHPDSTALVDGDNRTSWQSLDRQVEGLARGLAELGLVAGHRVAIAAANRAEFVASYLAVLRGGMVAVPVNPTSRPGEVARVLADSGARVCFADSGAVPSVREAVGQLSSFVRVVVVGGSPAAGEIDYAHLPADGARIVSPRDPESLALLVYTSGTSGSPRAAMLSHRALLANIEQAASTTPPPVRHGDVVLGVLPMFHVYGLNAVLGQVLLTGATLVLGDRFDAEQTLALVERERVTCLPIAPPVVSAWLDLPRSADEPEVAARLSSVTMLLSGAAPLSEETVRTFEELTGITVEQGYGLTEAGPVVTSTIGSPTHKPGSAGRALPGVELRVVDDTGTDVHPADPGEIWVRGDNVFSGYWPDHDAAPGPGGWLRTGDIGFLDADGDLYLVDRLKELVIVSGFNVYPSEIEDVIDEVDGVGECAVIGASQADTGETVVAYVVPAAGSTEAEPTDGARAALEAAVLAHCADRLARFKVPSRVEVVSELPHSASGKVAKGRLRAHQARHELGLS
jgi:long-chain acyl-CoA synthetase